MYTPTLFEIAFPIGLGVLFGITRYVKLQQQGAPDATRAALADGAKGVLGAGAIMIAYKFLGIV